MKYKVRLSYAVEMVVEAQSDEEVTDWLNCTTPTEAKQMAENMVQEEYSETILYQMQDEALADYVISGEK